MPTDEPPTPRPVVLPDGLARDELLRRVGEASRSAGGPLRLEGHGSSGVAALSLALHQRRLGLHIVEVICIGARGQDDPVSGRRLDTPGAPRAATNVRIVAGDDDESRAWTAATADAWRAAGWAVS